MPQHLSIFLPSSETYWTNPFLNARLKHGHITLYIEDIYFSEVNTKYFSSNVFKISVISRVLRTREITDIFKTFVEIFLVFTEKKNSLFFSVKGKT